MQYKLRVIDFETTGFPDAETEHSVIEAAYVDCNPETKEISKNHYQRLVKPSTALDVRALAVHHITELEANQDGDDWIHAQSMMSSFTQGEEIIYVAHNADFEKQFFNPEGAKWIDTYKVALRLYPDAPSHSNQVLKYYLGIENKTHHHPPHRALPDCYVTSEILMIMAKEMTFNEMIKISKEPPFITKISFGKHRGVKYSEAPKDYLQWIVRQTDMDAGVIAAAQRNL